MNPEFRRNLWLQLSWPRLVLAPVLVGAILAVVWTSAGRGMAMTVADYGFWAAAVLWGTRRAADAVAEELSGGTWHSQRISSLGAWPMTWGKLLGATAFPWYVALICLLVHQVAWTLPGSGACGGSVLPPTAPGAANQAECFNSHMRFWAAPVWMIVIALSAQATALAVSLAVLRRRPLSLRLPVAMAQGVALLLLLLLKQIYPVAVGMQLVFSASLDGYQTRVPGRTPWYGILIDTITFAHLSLAVILAVSLLAAYRLMRVALQYRSWPWGIVVGTLLPAVLLLGSRPERNTGPSGAEMVLFAGWIAVYVTLFTDRIDFPRLQRLLRAARAGDWNRTLRLSPGWLAAFLFAILVSIAVAALGMPGQLYLPGAPSMLPTTRLEAAGPAMAAQLFYILRDIAIVLWFHLAITARRADLAAAVVLGVLYLLLPFAVDALGLGARLAAVNPMGRSLAAVVLAAAEAGIAWFVLSLRWREQARRLAQSAPPAAAPSRM